MTYTLLRQFDFDVSLLSQRAVILDYSQRYGLSSEKEFIEFNSVGKELPDRTILHDFLHTLKDDDQLIIASIETLSNDMGEALVLINCLLSRNAVLHIASQDLKVTPKTDISSILPLLVQLEKPKSSEGIGHKVGRPKGSRSASKFDPLLSKILDGLKSGESVSAIARNLGVSRSSLKDYIESRKLKKIMDDRWIESLKEKFEPKTAEQPEMVCTLNDETQITNKG